MSSNRGLVGRTARGFAVLLMLGVIVAPPARASVQCSYTGSGCNAGYAATATFQCISPSLLKISVKNTSTIFATQSADNILSSLTFDGASPVDSPSDNALVAPGSTLLPLGTSDCNAMLNGPDVSCEWSAGANYCVDGPQCAGNDNTCLASQPQCGLSFISSRQSTDINCDLGSNFVLEPGSIDGSTDGPDFGTLALGRSSGGNEAVQDTLDVVVDVGTCVESAAFCTGCATYGSHFRHACGSVVTTTSSTTTSSTTTTSTTTSSTTTTLPPTTTTTTLPPTTTTTTSSTTTTTTSTTTTTAAPSTTSTTTTVTTTSSTTTTVTTSTTTTTATTTTITTTTTLASTTSTTTTTVTTTSTTTTTTVATSSTTTTTATTSTTTTTSSSSTTTPTTSSTTTTGPSTTSTTTTSVTSTTGTTTPLSACEDVLDHFKCYKVRSNVPFTRQGVLTTDQFRSASVQVLRPYRLCNPADKNGEGINDQTAHQMCYQIKDGPGFTRRDVLITNQFGQQTLSVTRGETLCVPAEKNGVPSALNLDRFKCYQVRQSGAHAFTPLTVSVTDQFETKQTQVLKPFVLCNPVDENGSGILNPSCHLTCYKIVDAPGQTPLPAQSVTADDEFSDGDVSPFRGDCRKTSLLCVPSLKEELP